MRWVCEKRPGTPARPPFCHCFCATGGLFSLPRPGCPSALERSQLLDHGRWLLLRLDRDLALFARGAQLRRLELFPATRGHLDLVGGLQPRGQRQHRSQSTQREKKKRRRPWPGSLLWGRAAAWQSVAQDGSECSHATFRIRNARGPGRDKATHRRHGRLPLNLLLRRRLGLGRRLFWPGLAARLAQPRLRPGPAPAAAALLPPCGDPRRRGTTAAWLPPPPSG